MENNITGFFETYHDPQRGWMLSNYLKKMLRASVVKIHDKQYNIAPGNQKVITDTSYNTAKSMSDMEKLVFRDILRKTDYYKRQPTKSRMSGRDRYIKIDLDNDVRKILNLDTKIKGKVFEKIVMTSNIIDIYLTLTDTLTEASALIDQLYKNGEIQKSSHIEMLLTIFQLIKRSYLVIY